MLVHMSKLDATYVANRSVSDTLEAINDDLWNRKADPTVFRINVPTACSKKSILGGLHQWFVDSNIGTLNLNLEGPPEGLRFVLRFNHADEPTRISLALQLGGNLRVDGRWREFSNANGRIYVEKNKNPKRGREEMLGKRVLKQLLVDQPEGTKAWLDKRSDGHVVVRYTAPG